MLKKIWQLLDTILTEITLALIWIYQKTLSPDKGMFSLVLKGRVCAHEPHCSEYGKRTLKRYGFFNGIGKVIDRVLHCRPSMQKIYDPEYYKVVFFCSAPIGVPFLEELKRDKRFDVIGIVTQADKPVGRGMKMQENIIKSSAKTLFPDEGKKNKKLLVIHGFASHPKQIRFPRLKKWGVEHNMQVEIPLLPNPKKPVFEDQLNYLLKNYKDRVDEGTTIIAHSLWGTLAKQFITSTGKQVGQLIDIVPSYPGREYEKLTENKLYAKAIPFLKTYIVDHPLDTKELTLLVKEHTILLSEDDPVNPFEVSLQYHQKYYPHANIQIHKDKGHFSEMSELPELETYLQSDFSDFIKTPYKLNPEKSIEGKTFTDWLKTKEADFLVVISYGKIIPQTILNIPHFAPINVHGSLLPKYRGASPLQSIFLNKDIESWITIMKMDAGMDTGDIIDELRFKIPFHRTVQELIAALQKKGPAFLNETLWNYGKGLITAEPQNDAEANYCQKIEKADGFFILSTDSLDDIYAKYRAFSLRPKIWFQRQEKRIIVEELKLDEELFEVHKTEPLLHEGKLNKAVKNISLRPEGKKPMDRASFKNGYLR